MDKTSGTVHLFVVSSVATSSTAAFSTGWKGGAEEPFKGLSRNLSGDWGLM